MSKKDEGISPTLVIIIIAIAIPGAGAGLAAGLFSLFGWILVLAIPVGLFIAGCLGLNKIIEKLDKYETEKYIRLESAKHADLGYTSKENT